MTVRPLLAALALAALGAGPAPRPIAPATFIAWGPATIGQTVSADGLIATNVTRPCPPVPQAEAGCIVPVARLRAASGGPTVDLAGAVGNPGGMGGDTARLAIGPLDGGRAGAVLTSYSGGAHCCESYVVAVPAPGGWRTLAIARTEITDRGPVRQTGFDYGLTGFPTDRNGDGRADFVMGDDAFAYAFTDYADSWTPPVILNVGAGGVTDVSRSPSFRPLFEADMVKARAACVAPEPERSPNGACAAYAADAARLGRLAEAWPVILARYDRRLDSGEGYSRCTADYVAGHCPAGHEIRYASYPAALRDFLRRTGYLDHQPGAPRADDLRAKPR